MSSYHFIGIGGAGMSVIAELLHARGAYISGSDMNDSPTLQRLRNLGLNIYVGHRADHVPEDAVVVYSTAVPSTNPELVIAKERNQEVIHRSLALALAASGMDFVAVAGAHGKTTTSAMLAAALVEAGSNPSYAIGGSVLGLGAGARLGSGEVFIAEADESDGSFRNYTPRIAIVTNVESDHLDFYGTEEAFAAAFMDFARTIVADGLLICCADDQGAAKLAVAAASEGIRTLTYGTDPRADAVLNGDELTFGHMNVRLALQVAGHHNRLNAAAAFLAGTELGVPATLMARSLGAYQGAGRRFQPRGTADRVRVIDDYAHHPTEVAATLATARTQVGSGRVIVLFQPHLFSRTKNFAKRFAQALSAADEVVVCDIFPAREAPMPGVSSELITDQLAKAHYVGELEAAAAKVCELARPGDLVITMGAGSITNAAPLIVDALKERE